MPKPSSDLPAAQVWILRCMVQRQGIKRMRMLVEGGPVRCGHGTHKAQHGQSTYFKFNQTQNVGFRRDDAISYKVKGVKIMV